MTMQPDECFGSGASFLCTLPSPGMYIRQPCGIRAEHSEGPEPRTLGGVGAPTRLAQVSGREGGGKAPTGLWTT